MGGFNPEFFVYLYIQLALYLANRETAPIEEKNRELANWLI
jgi:hypothetical protein